MANDKGLGRGIEALFADNQLDTEEAVVQLKLGQLKPNPYQPRIRFDSHSLNELADSIKREGVFQPIIVRKVDNSSSYYEILAGERRYRASKKADKKTIPAIVRDTSDEQMMEIAVMENLQRENLTPLEEAKAYNTLMMKLNLTQVKLADRMGKSRSYIANCLRLLSLPTEVKAMIQNKQLSMGQARTLLSVDNRKDLIELAKIAYQKTLTVRDLNKRIAKLNSNRKNNSQPKKRRNNKSPYVRASEEQLQDKFGTMVSISNHHQNKGKIEIDYTSLNDLNRILKILDVNLD